MPPRWGWTICAVRTAVAVTFGGSLGQTISVASLIRPFALQSIFISVPSRGHFSGWNRKLQRHLLFVLVVAPAVADVDLVAFVSNHQKAEAAFARFDAID